MAIAFDSATDGSNNGGSGSSHTVSFNNVAGNLIVAAVAGDSSTDNITGCTWNGVAMTQLAKLTNAQTSNGRYDHYFYILSAATGTHNIVASAGSSHFIGICAASYSGVDTTGQPDASTTNTGSSAADLTTSLTTIANNCWAILAEFSYAGGAAPGAGAGTVRRAKDPADGGFGIFDNNGPKTPAGSVSLNTTQAFTVAIGHIMASFKPTGGAVLAATITTPTSSATYNNGTTSTITLGGTATLATSVTWANDRGGSGSATNTGTSYSTWSITGITLSLGSNVITVTAGDGSTTVTDTITVSYTATPENCRGFTSLGGASTDKITSALTTYTTQRTYAVWFNNVDSNLLFAKYTAALTEQINFGAGPIYYQRVWTGGTAAWSAPSPGSGWHHLAITYDSSSTSNAPLIYIDGVSQTVTLQTAASGTLVNNSDPYTLGNNGAGTGNWDGMLSEFAIWNRILSAAEILDMATAAGGYQGKSPLYYPTSLAEYIPLNDSPVTSKVLANPTVTGTAQQTGLAIDYPTFAGSLTATFTDSLAGGELL